MLSKLTERNAQKNKKLTENRQTKKKKTFLKFKGLNYNFLKLKDQN